MEPIADYLADLPGPTYGTDSYDRSDARFNLLEEMVAAEAWCHYEAGSPAALLVAHWAVRAVTLAPANLATRWSAPALLLFTVSGVILALRGWPTINAWLDALADYAHERELPRVLYVHIRHQPEALVHLPLYTFYIER